MLYTGKDQVQIAAYSLLKIATVVRVEELSVKVEMAPADSPEILLNPFLLKALKRDVTNNSSTLGYLLAWLLVVDHYIDSVNPHYNNRPLTFAIIIQTICGTYR